MPPPILALIIDLQRLESADLFDATTKAVTHWAVALNVSTAWLDPPGGAPSDGSLDWTLKPWRWDDRSIGPIGPLAKFDVRLFAGGAVTAHSPAALAVPKPFDLDVIQTEIEKLVTTAGHETTWKGVREDDPAAADAATLTPPFRRVLAGLSQMPVPIGQALGVNAYFYVEVPVTPPPAPGTPPAPAPTFRIAAAPQVVLHTTEIPSSIATPIVLVPSGNPKDNGEDVTTWDYRDDANVPFHVRAYLIVRDAAPPADAGEYFERRTLWVRRRTGQDFLPDVGDDWMARLKDRTGTFFDLAARAIDALREIAAGPDAGAVAPLREKLRWSFLAFLRDLASTGFSREPDDVTGPGAWLLEVVLHGIAKPGDKLLDEMAKRCNATLEAPEFPITTKKEPDLSWKAGVAEPAVFEASGATEDEAKKHVQDMVDRYLLRQWVGRLAAALPERLRPPLAETQGRIGDDHAESDADIDRGPAAKVLGAEADLWAAIHAEVRDDRVARRLIMDQWNEVALTLAEADKSHWNEMAPKIEKVLDEISPCRAAAALRLRRYWPAIFAGPPKTRADLETAMLDRLQAYLEARRLPGAQIVPRVLHADGLQQLRATFAHQVETYLAREVPSPVDDAERDDHARPTQVPHAVSIQVLEPAAFELKSQKDVLAEVAGVGLLAHDDTFKLNNGDPWRLLDAAGVSLRSKDAPKLLADGVVSPIAMRYVEDVRRTSVSYDNQPLGARSPLADDIVSQDNAVVTRPWSVEMVPSARPPWNLLPALRFGHQYRFLPFMVSNAGALPRQLTEPPTPTRHFGIVDSDQKAVSQRITDLLTAPKTATSPTYDRPVHYRRRVPIGPPAHPAGGVDKTLKTALVIPEGVAPLAREIEIPQFLCGKDDELWWFADAMNQNGLLRLDPADEFTVEFTLPKEHAALSLQLLDLAEGRAEVPCHAAVVVAADGTRASVAVRRVGRDEVHVLPLGDGKSHSVFLKASRGAGLLTIEVWLEAGTNTTRRVAVAVDGGSVAGRFAVRARQTAASPPDALLRLDCAGDCSVEIMLPRERAAFSLELLALAAGGAEVPCNAPIVVAADDVQASIAIKKAGIDEVHVVPLGEEVSYRAFLRTSGTGALLTIEIWLAVANTMTGPFAVPIAAGGAVGPFVVRARRTAAPPSDPRTVALAIVVPRVTPAAALSRAPAEPPRAVVLLKPESGKRDSAAFQLSLPATNFLTFDRWLESRAENGNPQMGPLLAPADREALWTRHLEQRAQFHDEKDDPFDVDDPAVEPRFVIEVFSIYPDRSRVAVATVDAATPVGTGAPERYRRPGLPLSVVTKAVAAAAVEAIGNGWRIVLPAGADGPRVYEVQVHSVAKLDALKNRCAAWMRRGRRAQILDTNGKAFDVVLCGAWRMLVEVAWVARHVTPKDEPWISGADLLAALKPVQEGDQLVVRLDTFAFTRTLIDAASRIEVRRQIWRWDGRPVPESPFVTAGAPEGADARLAANWDPIGFAGRSDDVHVSHAAIRLAGNPLPEVYREDLRSDPRAWYHRFGVALFSRYRGFFERGAAVVESVEAVAAGDVWRRLLVRCRPAETIGPPLVKAVVPLTSDHHAADPGDPSAVAGWLVLLREPWYGKWGLAEEFVAEIERKSGYAAGAGGIGPRELPEWGPDPVISTEAWRAPVRPGQPVPPEPTAEDGTWWLRGPRIERDRVEGPIGHTFDDESDNPLFGATSFVVRAPRLPEDMRRDLRWFFTRLRFRRRLAIAATASPRGAVDVELRARSRDDGRVVIVELPEKEKEKGDGPFDFSTRGSCDVTVQDLELLDEPAANGRVEATLDLVLPGEKDHVLRLRVEWKPSGDQTARVCSCTAYKEAELAELFVANRTAAGQKLVVTIGIDVEPAGTSSSKVKVRLAARWDKDPPKKAEFETSAQWGHDARGRETAGFLRYAATERDTDASTAPRVRMTVADAIRVHESEAVASHWTQLIPSDEVHVVVGEGLVVDTARRTIQLSGWVRKSPVSPGAPDTSLAQLQWLAILTSPTHDAGGHMRTESLIGLYGVAGAEGPGPDSRITLTPLSTSRDVAVTDTVRVRFLQLLSRGGAALPKDPDAMWTNLFGASDSTPDKADAIDEEASDPAHAPRALSRAFEVAPPWPWLGAVEALLDEFRRLDKTAAGASFLLGRALTTIYDDAGLADMPLKLVRNFVAAGQGGWRQFHVADAAGAQVLARSGVGVVAITGDDVALLVPMLPRVAPSAATVLYLNRQKPTDSALGVSASDVWKGSVTYHSRVR